MSKLFEKYKLEIATAILIRRCEEKLLELYNDGQLNGTVHTCIGQEFTGVAISKFLDINDFVVSNHRGHGHYISRTGDILGLFAELLGKEDGCSGGIGGSQHLFNFNYLSNGIQGGMTPIAAGIALAKKINGENSVAVAYIGDGTLGEGIIYETLNLSSIWNIPVVFVLENNGIAQSTSIRQTLAGDIGTRAKGFGVKYFNADTSDLNILFHNTELAIQTARVEKVPVLLEIKTNRIKAHSKGDDNRDEKLINSLLLNDPLNKLLQDDPIQFDKLMRAANDQIESALSKAIKMKTMITRKPEVDDRIGREVIWLDYMPVDNIRGNEAIYEILKAQMYLCQEVILLGEDIETANEYNPKSYGGAFNVTKDLSQLFTGRVKNTPISEAAITGIATGLAIAGKKPVLEIMFGDFMTLILDQIMQHAAKFRFMYNNQVRVPLIIRSPMGGYRGYGPTHSQSIEKHFMGIPGLDIVALNHRVDPRLVYKTVFLNQNSPTFIVENKIAYTKRLRDDLSPGMQAKITNEPYPTYMLQFEDELNIDCTVICYGGALLPVEHAIKKLFFEDELICEVICPTMINPINIKPMIESVTKSRRILIVEEGSSVAGFGSEVIAKLLESNIYPTIVKRLGNNEIIPCSIVAENDILPNEKNIYKTIKSMLDDNN